MPMLVRSNAALAAGKYSLKKYHNHKYNIDRRSPARTAYKNRNSSKNQNSKENEVDLMMIYESLSFHIEHLSYN